MKNTGSQASMPAFTYCSPPGNRRMRRPLSGKRRKKAYVFTAFMKRRWSLSRPEATVLLGYAGLEKEEIKAGIALLKDVL